MTKDQARAMLVETLNQASSALDNQSVGAALADPKGKVLLEDLDLDSLSVVDWSLQIENATGLEIGPGEMARFKTLDEITEYVARHAK